MISKDTILSRFIKAFGSPVPSKKGHFIVGSTRQNFGLTTDFKTCATLWLMRYNKERNRYPENKLITVNPLLVYPELKYRSQDIDNSLVDVYWPDEKLMSGLHILDSKPFQRVEVSYFPNEVLPLGITRKVDGEQLTVMIAPNVLPVSASTAEPKQSVFKGNPWHTGKLQPKWISQLQSTTFWIVETEFERFVKCRNCGVELQLQDWVNRTIRDGHPWCMCSCNTYDDFCGCMQTRQRIQYEKKAREIVKIRHYMKRWD